MSMATSSRAPTPPLSREPANSIQQNIHQILFKISHKRGQGPEGGKEGRLDLQGFYRLLSSEPTMNLKGIQIQR